MAKNEKEKQVEKKLYSGLYDAVDLQCNLSQIQELLREFKDVNEVTKKEVRISGTKAEVVGHLRSAVSHGYVPRLRVYELVQECEENGHQHVFFFKPKNPAIRALCSDGASVASDLFDESWGPEYFPTFDRPLNDRKWVDFRIGIGTKKRDWLGKIYGHEVRMKLKDRRRRCESPEGYEEILRYEAENYNLVDVVRWNSPDLLEIRIDNKGAHESGAIAERLSVVWGMLAPVLKQEDFVPWLLIPAMTTIMKERKENSERYTVGTCSVLDPKNGRIDFNPFEPHEALDGDAGRERALEQLLASGARGRRLVVAWKGFADGPKDLKELRTVVTGQDFNELVVAARTSAAILDYVTNQFRIAAKAVS